MKKIIIFYFFCCSISLFALPYLEKIDTLFFPQSAISNIPFSLNIKKIGAVVFTKDSIELLEFGNLHKKIALNDILMVHKKYSKERVLFWEISLSPIVAVLTAFLAHKAFMNIPVTIGTFALQMIVGYMAVKDMRIYLEIETKQETFTLHIGGNFRKFIKAFKNKGIKIKRK